MKFAQATTNPGSWLLSDNDVWSIPKTGGEQRFDVETTGYGWNLLTKLRGLAVSLDGKVYGMRAMNRPKESGYQQMGRVSIGGRMRKAFTSSKLFERPDGSLINVAVFIVSAD